MADLQTLPPRDSAVDACERAIRTAILDGRFTAGQRLPPERELAATLGVNRMTLRGAIGRLVATGLLSVRQGTSTTVRDWWGAGPELIAELAQRTASEGGFRAFAEDLLALRRSLARVVLERLAERPPGPSDHACLQEAVEALGKAIGRRAGVDELMALDLAISRTLVRATGRPVLALALNPVLDLLPHLPALRDAMYRDPASNLAGWQAVLAWSAAPSSPVDPLVAVLAERDRQTLLLL